MARRAQEPAPARRIPADHDAEVGVLHAMIQSAEQVPVGLDLLGVEDFFEPRCARVFAALASLHDQGAPTDLLTIETELARLGEPVPLNELHEFLFAEARPGSAAHYAKTVRRLATQRQAIAASAEIAEIGYGPWTDVGENLARIRALAEGVEERAEERRLLLWGESVAAWRDGFRAASEAGGLGWPTGWADLDRLFIGFRPGQYSILGGRPSTGKSALAVALALRLARSGRRVLYFSLEMSEDELHDRAVAYLARLPLDAVGRRRLSEAGEERITYAASQWPDLPLTFLHRRRATVADVAKAARRFRDLAGGVDLLIVDFLQLLHSTGDNRVQQVTAVSSDLRELAGTLAVPVLALSSLRRGEHGRPKLDDLKESGSLESDADCVFLLDREGQRDPESERKDVADVIVAKQRNGPTGTATLKFDPRIGVFSDLPREDAAEPLSMNYSPGG